MWAPAEDIDPVVLHAPARKSLGVFGAVCSLNGRLTARRTEEFCAQTFVDFLKQLLRHKRKSRKVIVVDAAGRGKTNLLSDLTENFILRQNFMGLFFSARQFRGRDEYDIESYVLRSIGIYD